MLKPILSFLFTLICLISSYTISFAQVTVEELAQTAKGFMQTSFNEPIKETSLSGTPVSLFNTAGEVIAYVYELQPQGYIVLASQKGISPVITFSAESNFSFEEDENNILLSMVKKDMTQRLAIYHENVAKGNQKAIQPYQKKWARFQQAETNKNYTTQYGPYCPSTWGGVNCKDENGAYVYVANYFTPNHYSPGCVASSTSILMHYYEWPQRGIGQHTDADNYGSSQGDYYANFGATNYDWANMLDEYDNLPSTDTERRAMGTLAYHCGVAFDMEYENSGSTSNTSWSPNVMSKYFRYTTHYKSRTWASFWSRVDQNLENAHPVTFAISDNDGAGVGHAVACDGYGQNAGENKFYHLHFGWWGTSNGWYDIRYAWNGTGGGYDLIDGGCLDFLPEPMMDDPIRTGSEKVFSLPWLVSNQLTWDAFELQESYNGGAWATLDNNFLSQTYPRTVLQSGNYKYRVKAKVDGSYYLDSYSEDQEVLVLRDDNNSVALDFDGNDSFFVNDNDYGDLDVSNNWTFETWVKVDNFHPGTGSSNDYDVIMDRKTVLSMYLISDNNADYAVRFVARSGSGNLIASLRSDNSSQNLNFGDWVHVAASRNGNTAVLFINGVEVASSTDPDFNLTSSTNGINFGARYWGGYERYLVGEMDEIRISDIARYTSGTNFTPNRSQLFSPDVNTKLLLHLDEGSGNSLGDASRHFFDNNLRDSPNYANWNILGPLPVMYSQPLNATQDGKAILLSWTTVVEHNNALFEIQRSAEGKQWLTIGKIEVKKNSLENKNYTFNDEMPEGSLNYYRLKQVDVDQQFEYSNIAVVELERNAGIQVYPNPATDFISIQPQSSNTAIESIKIFNMQGTFLARHNAVENNITQIPFGVYEPGVYIIQIALSDGQLISERIVKEK